MRSLTSVLTLAMLFTLAGDARAQDVAPPDLQTELRDLVAGPTAADREREAVRAFLDRADVEAVAASEGLDLESARAAVETMDDATMADLAGHLADVGEAADLVGGNTIVISSTTVIIVLLILILVT